MRLSAPGADPRALLALASPDAVLDAVTVTDPEGTILAINDGFRRLHGYTGSEVVGKTPRVLSSGLQTHATYAAMWHTILNGYRWEAELVDRTADGELRSIRSLLTPVRDGHGALVRFVAIQRELGPLLAGLSAQAAGILRVDVAGRCVLADARAADRFGSTPERLLGTGWLDELSTDDAEALREVLALASGRGRQGQLYVTGSDDDWVRLRILPAELGHGTWRGATVLLEPDDPGRAAPHIAAGPPDRPG